MSNVLVVGGGPAAQRFVERMHRRGHEGTLTVLGTEPEISCPRPPSPFTTEIHPVATVTGIDREHRRVLARVSGAETAFAYDTLVLAARARPLIPDIPGLVDSEGHLTEGVVAVGASADGTRIAGGAVVVLGDGPLAVETASTLAAHSGNGTSTLVCTTPHPLYTRLGETCSGMLSEELEEAGVTVIGGKTVVSREAGRLQYEDGTTLRADTLVLCTGAAPDTRLAREAGLNVHDGTVVDDQLRTSDPHIHAIGDCAEYDGQVTAGPNALWEQAETLAEILTGCATAYRPSPSSLRLRTDSVDVATIGCLTDLHQPGTRLISLTDRTNRRYARLAMRDERVVAAVLFGLPQAIATIGLLHRRGQHLPSDRLGLLLGLPPRPASDSSAANGSAPICLCNSVSKQTLFQAWRAGSHTVTALAEATRATTGCGGCSQSVEELCGAWARETRYEWEKAS